MTLPTIERRTLDLMLLTTQSRDERSAPLATYYRAVAPFTVFIEWENDQYSSFHLSSQRRQRTCQGLHRLHRPPLSPQ